MVVLYPLDLVANDEGGSLRADVGKLHRRQDRGGYLRKHHVVVTDVKHDRYSWIRPTSRVREKLMDYLGYAIGVIAMYALMSLLLQAMTY